MGYTPHLSTAVWVGYPDAGVAMPGAQGGTYAAPVWHAFMLPAHGEDCDDFPQPEDARRVPPVLRQVREHRQAGRRRTYGERRRRRRPTARGGTGTDQQFDPRYYEAPPQNAPDVQAPTRAGRRRRRRAPQRRAARRPAAQ